ncbi:hypothetical protein MGSAQ_000654 [marine sediment metagenome]|uniref:Uncharacterized protein n=1 Tax=marine sediment metagenome TaxID=412755 RepID=A0A1B6NWM3_9ZZZZ
MPFSSYFFLFARSVHTACFYHQHQPIFSLSFSDNKVAIPFSIIDNAAFTLSPRLSSNFTLSSMLCTNLCFIHM